MRHRERQELSPEGTRELEALDRALAGEPVDPDLEGVARLARELRSSRPRTSERFAAELDRRAAGGFESAAPRPKSERLRHWLAGARPVQFLAPAGAVATIAVVVAVAVVRSDGDGPGPAGDAGDTAALPTAEQPAPPGPPASGGAEELRAPGGAPLGAEQAADLPRPPGPGPDRLAPRRRERAIEISASLGLSADADEFEDVADGVVEVTDRYGGLVARSDETASGETSRASFELSIPSDRLDDALADLSGLAHVESRSEATEDITAPTVGARARLTDARAEVEALLRQLAAADTPAETREIRARLDVARAQVAGARDDVRRLARRAEFATVTVTVTSDGSGGGDWGVDEALGDVGDVLSTAAGVTLISLAVLVPLALLVALVALAYRLAVRRCRDRALDA